MRKKMCDMGSERERSESGRLPITFSPCYDIRVLGEEKLHPFELVTFVMPFHSMFLTVPILISFIAFITEESKL
jgi:hypothetical protein